MYIKQIIKEWKYMIKTDMASNKIIQTILYAGFEVHTAEVMKSTIFWDIMPCSLLSSACHLLSRWFLVRLIL
jgi:hypothetical protein